ncbi:MAG: hypothetical protein CR993_08825 [Rhodobacterales bacterium]|nr:MAG: hypothetical protein CR993_08825 [Rhodobacterales bacterium]
MAEQVYPGRNGAVDLIRAGALIGMCLLGVLYVVPEAECTGLDWVATEAVRVLFQFKVVLLFAFMLGWGVGAQMRRAKRARSSFTRPYLRRLAGLAVLGVLDVLLVTADDMLLLYALLGSAILPLRHLSARRLAQLAIVMLYVTLLLTGALAGLTYSGDVTLQETALGDSYPRSIPLRVGMWVHMLPMFLMFYAPLVFAAMLAGLAAYKSGLLASDGPGRARLMRLAPWFFVLGVLIPLAFPTEGGEPWVTFVGFLTFPVAASMGAAAYVAAALWLDRRGALPGFLAAPLAAAGRNSLTVYVLVGVLATWLFEAYGFGLEGALDNFAQVLVLFGIAVLAILLTQLLTFGRKHAPLERFLRGVTYGKW